VKGESINTTHSSWEKTKKSGGIVKSTPVPQTAEKTVQQLDKKDHHSQEVGEGGGSANLALKHRL